MQRAHINELINVKPMFNPKDTRRLRRVFDTIESNYRGLQALQVNEHTYAVIVVPSVLNKLPQAVQLTITRGQKFIGWSMKEFVEALLAEVELRESLQLATGEDDHEEIRDKSLPRHPPTMNALFAKKEEQAGCAYCLGNNNHEDCRKVTNKKERLTLLRKYSKCFKCIRKGDLVRDCIHHLSICEKTTVEREKEGNSEVTANCGYVGIGSKVTLQTAQRVVKGTKEKRVRVLFDSGSEKTFVTAHVMNEAGLSAIRKEWLEIKTFGGSGAKGRLLKGRLKGRLRQRKAG